MNILVVGSGAREHAMIVAFNRSPQKPTLFCCGSSLNPGIAAFTKQYWIGDLTDLNAMMNAISTWQIDLAIIGPEAPLEKGLADQLCQQDIKVVGPKQALARIETSKSYARDLMQRYHIAGLPKYAVFASMNGVAEFLTLLGERGYVIKANGLMGGKGVKVAGDHLHTFSQAFAFCEEMIEAGHTFVIEEKLIGQEFSFMCFCDGATLVPMPLVQDHKRAYEDDTGPNTGGMGSYSDATHRLPFLTQQDADDAFAINQAVIKALSQDNQDAYVGILYGSFIATRNGIYVIEFNARFGDPEALNVLSILESDFVDICLAMTQGQLSHQAIHFAKLATVCKYAVPMGYPDQPLKNVPIDVSEFHASARLYLGAVHDHDGAIVATGSRTAAFVGVADDLTNAEQSAEQNIKKIKGPLFHREDIGTATLIQKRIQHMQTLRTS
jgi:phosphoribosylamine--glycine ligase